MKPTVKFIVTFQDDDESFGDEVIKEIATNYLNDLCERIVIENMAVGTIVDMDYEIIEEKSDDR